MEIKPKSDEYFMQKALEQAQIALEFDEVPVGAVIVCNNQIIARGHNYIEHLNDVTAHAEMQAFTSASDYIGGKYLRECTLYVTLEPCVMCAGALYWSKIEKLIYSSCDIMKGFSQAGNLLHPKTIVKKGEYEKETTDLLNKFFRNKRK